MVISIMKDNEQGRGMETARAEEGGGGMILNQAFFSELSSWGEGLHTSRAETDRHSSYLCTIGKNYSSRS